MTIVKIPKKLRDAFKLITWGKIEEGISSAEKIKDFNAQKSIVSAEIAYFSYDFEKAVKLDTEALFHDDEWYAGNIITEHFAALNRVAIMLNKTVEIKDFYLRWLESKKNNEKQYNIAEIQINKQIEKLTADNSLSNTYTESDAPLSLSYFIENMQKAKPKLSIENATGISYILHFVYEKGKAQDFINLYEKSYKELIFDKHHIHAAKIYTYLGEIKKAENTLLYYAENIWYPVEYIQVMPMNLWGEDDLYKLLTKDLCLQILKTEKAKTLK